MVVKVTKHYGYVLYIANETDYTIRDIRVTVDNREFLLVNSLKPHDSVEKQLTYSVMLNHIQHLIYRLNIGPYEDVQGKTVRIQVTSEHSKEYNELCTFM